MTTDRKAPQTVPPEVPEAAEQPQAPDAVEIEEASEQAVDEQEDIALGDKFIGQPLLCRVMHPGTAVQSDDGGKRAGAIGPGQIALYAVARNEPARKEPLRGAFAEQQRRGGARRNERRGAHAK